MQQNADRQSFDTAASWVILSPIEKSIKEKIEKVGAPLKDWDVNIFRGILTGYNDAFIIDETKRQELIAQDPLSAEIIRPILRGRDIKRYEYHWAGLYLITTHNGVPDKGMPRIDITKYTAIKAHLDSYWHQIEKRTDQGDTPYHLRSCAYMDEFSKPKIIWAELARTGNAFTFDNEGHYLGNTGYILTLGDHSVKEMGYELLLAFLNSKAILFYLDMICSRFDDTGWRWLRQFVEFLPVPIIERSSNLKLINVVTRELHVRTTAGQQQVEDLVNDCFGFNTLERNYLRKNILPL